MKSSKPVQMQAKFCIVIATASPLEMFLSVRKVRLPQGQVVPSKKAYKRDKRVNIND